MARPEKNERKKLIMKHKKQLGEGMEDIREENENIKNPF